jgi:hypothetical protein
MSIVSGLGERGRCPYYQDLIAEGDLTNKKSLKYQVKFQKSF